MLTNQNKTLKLGDMSESRMLDNRDYIKCKRLVGTPLSLAPEVVKCQGSDQRSDVWGLGVTLYTLACLQPPFYEESMTALMNSICYKAPKPITHYSPSLNDFVFKMLQKKKEDRPIITDLINYFSERKVPCSELAIMSQLDQQNYQHYLNNASQSYSLKRT